MPSLQYLLDLGAGTFPLTGVFDKLGHVFYTIGQINTFFGTTMPVRNNLLVADEVAEPIVSDGIFTPFNAFQNSPQSYLSTLQALSNNIIKYDVSMAEALKDLSLSTAMQFIVNQMQYYNQTVKQCVLSSSITQVEQPAGKPSFVVSLYSKNGNVQENSFNEVLLMSCTADGQVSPLARGREAFKVQGNIAAPSSLSYQWPAGSGCNTPFSCVDAGTGNQAGVLNWLNNSNFESWAGGIPNGWTIATGPISQDTSLFFDGLSSLKVVGDSSTNIQFYQTVGVNTPFAPIPSDQLAINFWSYLNNPPSQGILQVSFQDQNGTILRDNAGNVSSASFNLTAFLSGQWTPCSCVFRTNSILPTNLRLVFTLTTPLSAGTNLNIDRLAMAEMTQFYPQGPSIAAFSGNQFSVVGDSYYLTVNNDNGGKFQRYFDQVFGMRALGLMLPSTTGTPTISDTLIS